MRGGAEPEHRRCEGVRSALVGLLLLALAGCGSNSRAPVEDRYPRRTGEPKVESFASKSSYRVQQGDTLYSIAFRYGMDFRKVAAANDIPLPYTIYPGQVIAMREAPIPAVQPARPAAVTPSAPSVTPVTPATSSTPASPPVNKPAPVPSTRAAAAPAASAATFTGATVTGWRWPTQGRVTRGYSDSVHKGIDIDGKRGDPIYAVAAGKVVYAGSGIVGFGELLIVKHNDVYLSAYGHNDELLVREGDLVGAGQKIAQKGSSGTDVVKLHFEIRKAGKPVDPQRLLPRR